MDLRIYPAPSLRKRAKPVREITDDVRRRCQEMLALMYEAKGVGLAAPQVGWDAQAVVMDTSQERNQPRAYINPSILAATGVLEESEGCLSVPGVTARVRRAKRVVVAACSLDGQRHEMTCEDLESRVWQHETDHLSGILFVDHLTPAQRLTVSDELKALELEAGHERTGSARGRATSR